MTYCAMLTDCRSYGEVPWDTMLAPKIWAPTNTTEEKPDMVSHRWSNKGYEPAAQEWQVSRGSERDRITDCFCFVFLDS